MTATKRWNCPQCGKMYLLKGEPPIRCRKCRQNYTEADPPPKPEWMQKHAARKRESAFVPASSPQAFSVAEFPEIKASPPVRQRRPRRSGPLPVMLVLYGLWFALCVFLAYFKEGDVAYRLTLFGLWVTVLPALFAAYMLPTLIASFRGHANAAPIGVVNLCFGWTFIGYVAALAWSLTAPVSGR